ncbi:MAG TPA: anthranilate phosphoribosyltransferase [Pyrinomonadaceae bacterium]|nr:anthranilate phosphoribosyltransferase [Pyrinomonadaceae bacterium]
MNHTTPATGPQTSDSKLKNFIGRLVRREDLSRSEANDLLEALLNGEAADGQIAATLIALKLKGETVEELAGLAEGMRARATRIQSRHERFIDTAGTGSSSAKCFNVSTAAAFVIAGAGLPVAKHGNRAASSKCGSADVLSALGVNVSVAPEISERCLNELGICFMFAPLYHGATARVAGIRRQLGVQTTFNLLGPLTNPAGAPRQIIGVSNRDFVEPMARALTLLGTERAWVVHGADSLDEITLADKTFGAEASNGNSRTFEIAPEDFGVQRSPLDGLAGEGAEENATTIREILGGQRRDAARTLVMLNAAAALHVGGSAADLKEGMRLAEDSIDSGRAVGKLNELVRTTSASE